MRRVWIAGIGAVALVWSGGAAQARAKQASASPPSTQQQAIVVQPKPGESRQIVAPPGSTVIVKTRETANAQQAQQLQQAEQRAQQAEARARAALEKVGTVQKDARGLVVSLAAPVLFRFDDATIMETAKPRLDQIAYALCKSGTSSFRIEGHSDAIGSNEYNQGLSERRAEAVRDYLIQRGVKPDQIAAEGFGKKDPVASNDNPEGRANNRRVEIVLPQFGAGAQTGVGGAGSAGGPNEPGATSGPPAAKGSAGH